MTGIPFPLIAPYTFTRGDLPTIRIPTVPGNQHKDAPHALTLAPNDRRGVWVWNIEGSHPARCPMTGVEGTEGLNPADLLKRLGLPAPLPLPIDRRSIPVLPWNWPLCPTGWSPLNLPHAAEYCTSLLCPVCGAVLDELTHTAPDPGEAAMYMGGDGRHHHAIASPQCVGQRDWIKGWDYGPTVPLSITVDATLLGGLTGGQS